MLLPFGKAGRLRLEQLEPRDVPSRPLPYPVIFAGTGAGTSAVVKAFAAETAAPLFERTAFEPGFAGGTHVAAADFTADGFPDAVIAPGAGGGPRVRVLDGKTGEPIPGPVASFFAYDPSFAGGVRVAAADVDGDGVPDVVTAAGAGGGPHVRVFSGATGAVLHSFLALEPEFRGGVNVAAADYTGDGRAEVVVGAGDGGGPRVRVLDLTTGSPIPGPLGDFFALDPSTRSGVYVGTDARTGDVNADAVPDLVAGSGPGGSARVVVYGGRDGAVLADFAPFGAGMTAGVRVATAFVDDDGYADVVAGTGPGVAATVRVFSGKTFELLPGPAGEFRPFGDGELGGVFVGATNDPPSYAAPESAADAYAVVHDQTLEAGDGKEFTGLLGNDRDRDNEQLKAYLVSPPAGQPATVGTVTVSEDGSFKYVPAAKWVGEDTFWYVAKDEAAVEGKPTPVAVSVVNHRPLAGALVAFRPPPYGVSGTLPRADGDGDTLTSKLVTPALSGTAEVQSGGGFTYTPTPFNMGLDWFTYEVSDGVTASTTGTVLVVRADPPPNPGLDTDSNAYHIRHDRTLKGYAMYNGVRGLYVPGLTMLIDTPPAHGTLTVLEGSEFKYVPDKAFVGADEFIYHLEDGPYKTLPVPLTIDVANVNPVARADSFVTGQTTAITKSVAPNDDDTWGEEEFPTDQDALTWELVSGPDKGKLEFQGNGTFTYTPPVDFVGVTKFTYKVSDGVEWSGVTSAYVTVFEDPASSIGDTVWLDADEDGFQDPTEKGIEGVRVDALRYDYTSGAYVKTGEHYASTQSTGWFSIDNLFSGKYKLLFTNPDVVRYFFTHPDHVPGDDTNDSDAYRDIDPATGKEGNITGTTKQVYSVGVGDRVMNVDCGMVEVTVEIDIDADRNGSVTIDNNSQDETREESIGTILVANKDNVYERDLQAPTEDRAQRREFVATSNVQGGKVIVTRNNNSIKLFTKKSNDEAFDMELFGGGNQVELVSGISYWLQGGANASANVRDIELKARPPGENTPFQDTVKATVIWVDVAPNPNANGEISGPAVYDRKNNVVTLLDQIKYGVNRLGLGATVVFPKLTATGIIEVQGSISPTDIMQYDANLAWPKTFKVWVPGKKTTADFGFTWRRHLDNRDYWNGQNDEDHTTGSDGRIDDSDFDFQDPRPTASGSKLVITDVDGPTASVQPSTRHFTHIRNNFKEYTVFHYVADQSERSSPKHMWSTKYDVAANYTSEVVFILGDPNNQADTNEVFTNTNLVNLDLGAIAKPIITAVSTQQISNSQETVITVTGQHLIGDFKLRKGTAAITSPLVRVKETDLVKHTSNLTEAKVTFILSGTLTLGAGYELVAINSGGETTMQGFEVTA